MEFEVASLTDIEDLIGLLSILFLQEAEFQPDQDAQTRGLKRLIGNPEKGHVLIARKDGEIQGMVCLLYTISTALGSTVALLEDMVVAPQGRGQNIGSGLLEYALSFAKDKGCKRVTLLTDQDNEGAHRFYQGHGFERSSMMPFRLSFDQN